MPLPALRPVEAVPVEHEGDIMILLRDPFGLVDGQLILTPAAYYLATLLDGESDIADLQASYHRETEGGSVDESDIRMLVDYLDESGFLATPRFTEKARRICTEFFESPVRPAHLAGLSYPDDPDELRPFLDGIFLREDAPGRLPRDAQRDAPPVRCLIAPHIDYARGGHSYAHAYLRLAQAPPPQTLIVFGVAHAAPPVPYTLSRKAFATPFGVLQNDAAVTDRLAAACPYNAFEHELVHRTEHSIELQAVLAAYLFGDKTAIVPILCGGFLDGDDTAESPDRVAAAHPLLEACAEILRERGDAVAIVAAADLAHIGPCFGDEDALDDAAIATMQRRDREDLAFVTAGDASGWYRSVMRDGNARRVCGINAIYSAVSAVNGLVTQTDLLHYGHAADPSGGVVSFAAAALS